MRLGNISRFSVKDIFLCLLLGLSFLFSLEVLSTGVDEHARQSQWPFLYGEFGVIEIIQIFVLAFGLAINLRFPLARIMEAGGVLEADWRIFLARPRS